MITFLQPFDMQFCLFLCGEDARGLTDIVCTASTPRDGTWVLLMEDADLLPMHDEKFLIAFLLACYRSGELLVNAIVFKLVDHVL